MPARTLGLSMLVLVAVLGDALASQRPLLDPADPSREVMGPVGPLIGNLDSLRRLGIIGRPEDPPLAPAGVRERGRAPLSPGVIDGRWGPIPPPSSRYAHVSIYDPRGRRLLLLTGRDSGYPPEDAVWAFDLAGSRGWTRVDVTGVRPATREQAAGVYDPIGHRAIVYGGLFAGSDGSFSRFADTWALSLDEPMTWSRLVPSGSPPPARYGHTATYDPLRHRMIVIGGFTQTELSNEVWELSLGPDPAWRRLIPSGRPPDPRYHHAATYDSDRDRVLLHGGA